MLNCIKKIIPIIFFLALAGCNKLPENWGAESDFNPRNTSTYDERSLHVYANKGDWTASGISYNSDSEEVLVEVFETTPDYTGLPSKDISVASGSVSLCSSKGSDGVLRRGCLYVNSVHLTDEPRSNSDDGRVEYIIADKKPSDTAKGKVIRSSIPFQGDTIIGEEVSSGNQGKFWFRIIDSNTTRSDNVGRYKITVRQKRSTATSSSSFLSKLSKFVIEPITKQIDYTSEFMFETGARSEVFKNIIRAALLLYIMIYGITFLIGVKSFSQKDLLSRIVRVGIVLTLISDTGINFFNDYLFDLFRNGQKELLNVIADPSLASGGSGKLNYDALFSFANYTITTIFSSHFLSVIVAFIMWFPIGWIGLILLLYAVVVYILAILEVLILYVISYTGIGLMIALGPLFIPLILFKQTRKLFDGWLKAMVSFAMRPIIMFAGIMLITAFINDTIYNLLNLELTVKAVLPIYLDFGSLGKLPLFTIHWINPVKPALQVMTDILIFYIFIELLKKVSTLAGDLSDHIFGSVGREGDLARSMAGSVKKGAQAALGAPLAAYQSMSGNKDSSAKGKEDNNRKKEKGRSGVNVSSQRPEVKSSSKSSGIGVSTAVPNRTTRT